MRSVSVRHFGYVAKRQLRETRSERLDKAIVSRLARLRSPSAHAHPCLDKRPYEPRPHRAHVVRAIPLLLSSPVVPDVSRLIGRQ